jgi:hypothetical protein
MVSASQKRMIYPIDITSLVSLGSQKAGSQNVPYRSLSDPQARNIIGYLPLGLVSQEFGESTQYPENLRMNATWGVPPSNFQKGGHEANGPILLE